MDAQHRQVAFRLSEVDHRYGPSVHLLSDPLDLTLLARLCQKGVVQPEVSSIVAQLYRGLAHSVVSAEFPRRLTSVPTRMIDSTPLGVWNGEVVADDTRTVVVALARAGLVPAQVTYDFLHRVLRPDVVRQDHLSLGRATDPAGRVTGAILGAAKIGGPIDDSVVLIPDPMGATGSTVSTALAHYRKTGAEPPAKIIAMHLIVTPEYLKRVSAEASAVVVYALRLDRGLSSPEVLQSVPGSRWDEERGLDGHHYIVPGGGGLGEVLNNSFV